MKPTWKAIYPFTQTARSHRKRDTGNQLLQTTESDRQELANILRDDDSDEHDKPDKKNAKKDLASLPRHNKTKRQSDTDEPETPKDGDTEEHSATQTKDFQVRVYGFSMEFRWLVFRYLYSHGKSSESREMFNIDWNQIK